MKGIIYKATNTITGQVYIGATTSSIEERKQDHIQKAYTHCGYKFQEAIFTYGEESFSWQQIDTADSSEELAKKEIQYISEYNSYEQGYNGDKGGTMSKPVYRYFSDGTFDREFSNLTEAGESIGVRKQDISRACWSVNHSLGGYFWDYERYEIFPDVVDSRKKPVKQFDLDGNFLAEYDSASEASRKTGVSKTCITRCCRGEREKSRGFMWQFC